jgi:anti-sigma B factor antagonist
MRAKAMPGVHAEKSARAGCVIIALRGELDVCTAAGPVRALTALAAAGARVVVDLAELAYMDCYSLNQLMAVRALARRAGGILMLAGPQPMVLRLLVLRDIVSHWPVFTSVDEAVSGAGSAPAASPARPGIVSSALYRGEAAVRRARMLPELITAVSRQRRDGGGAN